MAKFEIMAPDGQKYEVNAPEGATEDEAIQYVQNNLYSPQEETPAPQKQRGTGEKLLRQVGLTARHGIQGLANTAGIVSDPVAGLSNRMFGTNLNTLGGATGGLLNDIGLPQPENARERNVASASELLAGTGGIIGVAGKGGKAAQMLAARPGMQAGSAIGAGYAGNEAKERGGGPVEQFGASLLGGLGVPLGVAGADAMVNRGVQTFQNIFTPSQIKQKVDASINQAGININSLPGAARTQLRQDVQKALKTGNQTSPDALRRLADYRALEAVPMRGNLTLNPVDITRDKNLAKLAANSSDLTANQLPMLQNRNNTQLINNLNTLGANTTDDAYGAGAKIIGALDNRNTAAKGIIKSGYDTAKAANGRSANLDPSAFTNQANNLLDEALLGGKLPADVRNLLNKTAKGEMPLTVDVAEQFKTRIGDLQRASSDPAERMALGKVREALDNTPLLEGQEIGAEALSAFNKARRVNRAYMQVVEKTPALKAVRDGIEPDKFVNQYIIGNGTNANVMDVAMIKKNIKGSPEAMQAIRGQILSHLKSKGVGGAADEVANLSSSNYNKALESIGERKLALFFEQPEIDQLKRIGRVASYESFQPKGSAVNNSNTAAAAFSHVIDGIGKYIPFGEQIVAKPVQNIGTSISSRNALDASKALTLPKNRQVLPALYPLGLLAAE
jgi:hypothetical protein